MTQLNGRLDGMAAALDEIAHEYRDAVRGNFAESDPAGLMRVKERSFSLCERLGIDLERFHDYVRDMMPEALPYTVG